MEKNLQTNDYPQIMLNCEGCRLADYSGECKVFKDVPVYSFLCKAVNDKKTVGRTIYLIDNEVKH